MQIGAHLSVAGGYAQTMAYAADVGAECMQIFAKSPRQWRAKPLDRDRANEFARLRDEAGFGVVFTHSAYLINLSTTDDALRATSIAALADEIDRARLLGAAGVVTHVGNDPAGDEHEAARRAADSISRAFAACHEPPGHTRLLLENTAGAGRSFGCTFGQLGEVIGQIAPGARESVGVCLDTCHAHAFGMDLMTPSAWSTLVDEIEATCGADALGVIHANDCTFERGSRRDRHAWVGDGFLGYEGFSALVCEPRLLTVPVVTEMPGEVPNKDIENLSRLKRLRAECAGLG